MEGEFPSVDRTRVLDVKPFRRLVPIFPSQPSYSGPYQPGISPFYPFSGPQVARPPPDLNHGPTPSPAPLRSYRPTHSNENALVDVEAGKRSSGGSHLNRSRNYYRKKVRMDLSVVNDKFVLGISSADQEDGDRDVVTSVLMRFDALRRRLSQLDDCKEGLSGLIRCSNLKAGNILMTKGVRTNMRKRMGVVPGVEIGDVFFFRMELCMVGLHSLPMAGIDYMVVGDVVGEEPLTLSIVTSGVYEDEAEDTNVLVYSGSGGNSATDQKLKRGNLALERSSRKLNEIRVIRGVRDHASQNNKIYVYDGLYRIQHSWMEKGKSGGHMFKFKLVRIAGQPEAYAVWKLVEKWKAGLLSRVGLILPDITSGGESIPVPLVNDVDEEKGPAYFTYLPTIKYHKSFRLTDLSNRCSCPNACEPGNLDCSCIRKNGGDFPYTTNGVLVSRKPLISECGNACPCIPNCKNRVSHGGLKIHVEVFKTRDRGWGLRTWDPVRAGTFICEYAGEVIDKATLEHNRREVEYDDYVFDTSRVYHPFKWNCEDGLIGNCGSEDSNEEYNIPSPIFVSSKNVGNVARFMNHSCDPNTFWQPIVYEENNDVFVHIAFFAMRHIPPMTELTYDYGKSGLNEIKKKCLCGSPKCRGYFG